METISPATLLEELDPDRLQSGSVFGAISREAIRFLLENGRILRVARGDLIFSRGDPGDTFYIVCQGSLDFYKYHRDAYAYTRSILPGSEVGFEAMIALHERMGKVVAPEDGIVLEISSGLFADLHERHPFDFGIMTLNLARELSRVVRKLSDILVENAIDH